jgi:serine/threonine-protein kinase
MATEAAERAIEIDPSFPPGYAFRGMAEVEKEMYDRAIADFQEADKLLDSQFFLGRIGYVHAILGRTSEANKVLDQLKNDSHQRRTEDPDLQFVRIAYVHIGLGNNELALDLLEKAFDNHSHSMTHLKSEPIYAKIHGEPRYRALLRKVGLDR